VKRFIAALFVALIAFPSAALAVQDNLEPPPLVRPDGPALESHLPAQGTDVAAPDQQASPPASALITEPSEGGFDWADAGIGAAGATALLGFAIAGAAGLRRRRAVPLAG